MKNEIFLFTKEIGAENLEPRIPNSRQNYFILNQTPLIVKISRLELYKPFWGVGEKYINLFNTRYRDYVLVLLTSREAGWFFNKKEINDFIENNKWHLREVDNNYKIIPPLPSSNRFNSTTEFISKCNIFGSQRITLLPEEITTPEKYYEGASHQISVNIYERNIEARNKCIEHYGYYCFVCGFSFAKKYGPVGLNIIQVHHLKPLSEINRSYELNPLIDLRPVCPNCHSMIHHKTPPYSIDEIKSFIESARIKNI